MSNKLWKLLLASPAVIGMGMGGSAVAAEATSIESLEAAHESRELAQITSIDELTDVSPTDWAYTALQNLVNQYGCIEGYPNRTFRGGQPLTRYEFAAGLNACLDVIAAAIGLGGVSESDLATIQRLQEEFAAELATLRGRVDALEAEVQELRDQQFSTTTKLRAQVDANLVVPAGDIDTDEETAFTARARLNFDASFTGEDRLRVRLQAGDDDFGILSAGGGLANSAGGDFDVEINDFYYSFPLGGRIDAIVAANSIVTDDFVTSTIVPFDGPSVADPGGPALYDFDMGGGGFAGGLSFALTDNIVIDAGYSADNGGSGSNDPDDGGIFGADSQSYIGQISYLSDGLFNAAFAYLRGNDGDDDDFTDTFAGLLNLDFGGFMVSGTVAYHDNGDDDDVSWMAGVAVPDIFIEGAQLGVYYADLPDYDDDPYMIEGYFEVPVNQFLTITPAVIYGDLDTGGDDDSFYGAIRATFSF
ncbi:MAG: carbohydrate porin [Leptolyngbya sp. SIO1E4]|nr:carbohydrate porin [Leptolyngbya sp. SIO1E4]